MNRPGFLFLRSIYVKKDRALLSLSVYISMFQWLWSFFKIRVCLIILNFRDCRHANNKQRFDCRSKLINANQCENVYLCVRVCVRRSVLWMTFASNFFAVLLFRTVYYLRWINKKKLIEYTILLSLSLFLVIFYG